MKQTLLLLLFAICFYALYSCSDDQEYKEMTAENFKEEILGNEEIYEVKIYHEEYVDVYTNSDLPYRITFNSNGRLRYFLSELRKESQGDWTESYIHSTSAFSTAGWLFTLSLPFLFLLHFLVLTVSLIKIVKATIDPTEKLVHTLIVIFVPLIGSIIYLFYRKRINQ